MKILYKILLPVLLATALGLFVSTMYTYQMSMETLKETNTSRQKMAIANALVELKAGLDFNILNAISLAQTGILQPFLSDDPVERQKFAPDANSRIVNMTNTYFYVMIGILDPNGIVLDHTEKSFIGESFKDVPFFKKAMEGKVSIGMPYRYKDMVVYAVASPVHDLKTQKIIGVVFNVSKLTDTMSERMHLGEEGYLYVVDQKGTVFIHKDVNRVLNKNLSDFEWGRTILTSGHGHITYEEEGRQKLAYYDTLPEAGWTAVALTDLNELEAPSIRIRSNAIIIAIITLMVLAAIIYLYMKNIVDALLKAVRYAEQVATGVLDKDLNLGMSQQSYFIRFKRNISNFGRKLTGKNKKEHQTEKINTLNQLNRNDELGVLYHALQEMVLAMRNMVKKADDSNRMKSNFLANMSHEIRTPLNAVIGLAHLCLESKDDEEKKRDYIQKIQMAGKSLLGIINNVLDTSKIEAGMFELEAVHFSLREVGEHVLTIYNDSAKSKNLTLSFEYAEDLKKNYIGDPVRIGQVLNNLVGNSIKFTEKGGVHISCKPAQACEHAENIPEGTVPVCIQVSDTGIGFSKEQEKQLFKPFSQADNSITRRFGGTGLGLTISKQIVELMNGVMQVKSEVGVGTTFTLIVYLLPAKKIQGELIEELDIQDLKLKGKHILVVEDNMINQLLMEELLKSTEADVSIADNGKIAVDMVDEKMFDIILMDMQMPVMDGIQATGIIRQKYDAETLPIIAVTANAMKEDKEQGIKMGLNDYLTKPIDPRSLMVTLKHWLDKK